jgi:thiosulfate reductase / polysulfide reductase chain A
LALLNVIIQESLYDRNFVEKWCHGFTDLSQRVAGYTPEKVGIITGIEKEKIFDIARLFATLKPGTIFSGLGIDQSGRNCTQTLRSLAILRAITGNLDTEGACHLGERPDFIPEIELELPAMLSPEQRQKKLGPDLFLLQTSDCYEKLSRYTHLHDKRLPARYLTSAHPYLAWQAMIKGEPYPLRALIVMAANPLLTQANSRMVYEALKSLDLVVVLEQLMTPTAMLADYILPATGSLENSMVQLNGGISNLAYGGPAAIPPLYKRRNDYTFWHDLGLRCGQKEYWPWETLEDSLDYIFKPVGLSYREFCEAGFYSPTPTYLKYEKTGLATPSGKVELYASLLKEMGYDPLPAYMSLDNKSADYPLDLITGVRHQPFYASEFRQVKKLRRVRPEPLAEMDPVTASELNLNDGDRIWVETPEGRIQHTIQLVKMRPSVVAIEFGWWFPERPAAEPSLGGIWEANANLLTRTDVDRCDPILGQWSYRSLRCRVYEVD